VFHALVTLSLLGFTAFLVWSVGDWERSERRWVQDLYERTLEDEDDDD
jgi:uncharacterized membrane protein YbaN (DUF454 family)